MSAKSEDPVFIRRIATRTETVRKGLFGHEKRVVPAEETQPDESLWRVVRAPDGTLFAEFFEPGPPPGEPFELYAVSSAPRLVEWVVDLGRDANGFGWQLDLRGEVSVRDARDLLSSAAWKFPDRAAPAFGASGLLEMLGDVPKDIVLNKIKCDVVGLMKISDSVPGPDGTPVPFDMAGWAEERAMTCDAFSDALRRHAGTPFSEADGALLTIRVNGYGFRSPDREKAVDEEIRERTDRLASAATEAVSDLLSDLANLALSETTVDSVKVLDAAGRKEAGLRLAALASRQERARPGVVALGHDESFVIRERRLGPMRVRRPALREGRRYSLDIRSRRAGFLTLLDIDERDLVCPVLPNSDATNVRVRAGDSVPVGCPGSPWMALPLEECSSSGTETLVALVTEEPLLSPDETVPFGEELPAETAAALLGRLEALPRDAWNAAVLSFEILPATAP